MIMPNLKLMHVLKANSVLLALSFLIPATPLQAQQAPEKLPTSSSESSGATEKTPVPVLQPAQSAPEKPESGQEPEAVAPPADTAAPAAVLPESGADTAASVRVWLEKLAEAVTSLEYSGLVAFEHQGMLETLEVVHGLRSGEQVERVRYLSGAPRELVSRGHTAHCRRDGSPLSRAGLWTNMGQKNVQSLYHFLLRGTERVADRDTVVIEVRPRDIHRLGMVISLDKQTGLPLKSMLVASNGQVLERYQFVQLNLKPVTDKALQARSEVVRESDSAEGCGSTVSRWELRWVPPGYKPVATRELADGEMLVYSDGLSVFTVFVQSLGPEMRFTGRAVRGATVAYMDGLEDKGERYTVTVVGEIPEKTAQVLVRAVSVK